MSDDDWDDLLGTGTIMKRVLVAGNPNDQDIDMEAPRKFFALIDIETKCNDIVIKSDSHQNYLINSDADLFPGAHLVIPLMNVGEKSEYIFDPKFGYGEQGNPSASIPPGGKLECVITLKLRAAYDEFLEQLSMAERLKLAARKKERGMFWYSQANYQNAISIYESLTDLCKILSQSNE